MKRLTTHSPLDLMQIVAERGFSDGGTISAFSIDPQRKDGRYGDDDDDGEHFSFICKAPNGCPHVQALFVFSWHRSSSEETVVHEEGCV